MATEEYGAVIEVSTTNLGTAFAADAIVGATALTLTDVSMFDELGGQVYIAGTVYYYTAVDHTANTMTLLTGLVTAAVVDETRVELHPPAPIRTALVAFGGDEGEAVRVTIPHYFSGMPDGVRPPEARENALVEQRNPGELYLKDVPAKGMMLLGAGEDLDDYPAAGNFIQLYSADAVGGLNYPVPYAGVLEVVSTRPGDIMMQRYTAYRNANRIAPSAWTRTFGAAVWSAWEPYADDTGWITSIGSIAVAQANFTIVSASLRRINKTVHIKFDVQYTGTAITPQGTGNITDIGMVQMVAAYRPGTGSPDQAGMASSGNRGGVSAYITSTGIVMLAAVGGAGNIATNDTLGFGGSYLLV
jgi:hypothetical protein